MRCSSWTASICLARVDEATANRLGQQSTMTYVPGRLCANVAPPSQTKMAHRNREYVESTADQMLTRGATMESNGDKLTRTE